MTALGPARADELRRQLADALTLEEREERMLAAWVWTGADAFATGDIDLVVHASRSLEDALAQLGFERRGRFFVLPDAELFVEFLVRSYRPDGARPKWSPATSERLRARAADEGLEDALEELSRRADATREGATFGEDELRALARALRPGIL